MGLVDMFNAEDRMDIKYSDFYNLVKGCTERDLLVNCVKNSVPHYYVLDMLDMPRKPFDDPKEDDLK